MFNVTVSVTVEWETGETSAKSKSTMFHHDFISLASAAPPAVCSCSGTGVSHELTASDARVLGRGLQLTSRIHFSPLIIHFEAWQRTSVKKTHWPMDSIMNEGLPMRKKLIKVVTEA